jgi:integrase
MLFWDIDDVEGFLSSIKDTEYYPMFFTLLHTGMRRSEVLALRWKDIDLIFGQISISRGLHQLTDRSIIFKPPKSKMSRRTIAMTPANIKVITGYHLHREEQHKLLGMDKITDNDMVFSHIDGKPMLPNSVSHAWARLSSEYGNPIRLHDARHTHASILLQLGVHPKVVQERLGHANIGITLDIYSHIRPGMQEDAAKLFDKALAKTQE